MTPKERFNAKVQQQPNGCWLWTGRLANGQPEFEIDGARIKARRFAWRKGPPPRRIGTKCGEQLCVRPAHLKAVRSGPRPTQGIEPDAIVEFMLGNPSAHIECMRLFSLSELELLDILDIYFESQPRLDEPTETAPLHEFRSSNASIRIVHLFETTDELW